MSQSTSNTEPQATKPVGVRIIALTEAGQQLGLRLCAAMPGAELWFKPAPFAEKVQQAFRQGDPLIFICATGIVVRTLAPVLVSKREDPPVLVLDELGQFVIPLLSGHEGGANEWGRHVAGLLEAQLVMTTANAYLAPVYAVGMGCERHCSVDELSALLDECLQRAGLSISEVASIDSIDLKADEAGLVELAARLQKPFRTWSVSNLHTVEAQLSTRSDYVFRTVGVYGVAESAALFGAGQLTGHSAELLLTKQKSRRATCAIARSYRI